MKRLCLVFVLSFAPLLPSSAGAQDVDVGIRLGVATSTFTGKETELSPAGRRSGAGGGVSVGYAASRWASLRVELLLLAKGGTLLDTLGAKGRLAVTYVQLPLLAELHASAAPGHVRPRLFAGPAFAASASCRWTELEGSGSAGRVSRCDPQFGGVAAADIGLVGGAGLDLPMGRLTGTIEGRYEIGIKDVDQDKNAYAVLHNRAFVILAGVSIPVGPESPARTRWK